jgi:hypothetical protein
MTGMMDISGRTLLVGLKIRISSGEKRDKKITREICQSKGAKDKALRANKSLYGDALAPVRTAEGKLRDYVNERTLPWLDNGLRILKTTMVQDFQQALLGPTRDFERAVAEFVADYPATKERARRELADAFSEADFPPAHELMGKFGVEVTYMPMPRSTDFREALTGEELEMVRRNCEGALRDGVQQAVHDAVKRMRKPVEAMCERLRAYGKDGEGKTVGTFRDTLVENIREIVALAPGLNVTDDPRIASLVFEMEKHLAVHDGDALRVSPILRNQTAEQAERILKQLDGAFA